MIKLNERQRTILKALCAYLVVATIFPPFHLEFPGGVSRGLGFGFLFSPPEDGSGMVSAFQLAAEWCLGIAIAAVVIYLSSGWVEDTSAPSVASRLGPAMREGFRRSKSVMWILLGMSVVGLLAGIGGDNRQILHAFALVVNGPIFFFVAWLWHTQRAFRGVPKNNEKTNWKIVGIALVALIVTVAASYAWQRNKALSMSTTHPISSTAPNIFDQFDDPPKKPAGRELFQEAGVDEVKPWERQWDKSAGRDLFQEAGVVPNKGRFVFDDLVPAPNVSSDPVGRCGRRSESALILPV